MRAHDVDPERADRDALPEPAANVQPTPALMLLDVQRSAGNAAAARLMRQPAEADATEAEPSVSYGDEAQAPSTLSPEDQRKLVFAKTTLANVKPLPDADEEVLRQLIPGTPIMDMIAKRDAKRAELAKTVTEIEHGATSDGAGSRATLGVSELPAKADALRDELYPMNVAIRDACHALGIRDEDALRGLVEKRFPDLFLARAKTIAMQVLDENETVVRAEAARFGSTLDYQEFGDFKLAMSYTGTGGDAVAVEGMRAGAQELHTLQMEIEEAWGTVAAVNEENERLADEEDMDWRTGGDFWAPSLSPQTEPVQGKWRAAQEALATRRTELGLRFPVLLRDVSYEEIANASDQEVKAISGQELAGLLSNIEQTRQNIEDGDLKVWHLNDVFDMTAQDLGIGAESPLYKAVQERVRKEERDQSILDIALTAIAITAAVLAALPTAGASLVVAGTAVATTIGAYQLHKSASEYSAEKAASGVSLDPVLADISAKDPDLKAVAFDIVGLGLDAFDVAKVIKQLSRPIRTARTTGDLLPLAQLARQMPELGEDGAKVVLASVGRDAAVAGRVANVIQAIGARMANADIAKIEAELARYGESAIARGFDDLKAADRIRPLTQEALEEIYTLERAEHLITNDRVLGWLGMYDPQSGVLFLRGGTVEEATSTALHEIVHHLQDTLRPDMSRFAMEFEAYAAQRNYLQRLVADGGDPAVLFPRDMWLLDADDAGIMHHLATRYGLAGGADFDSGAAVMDALTSLDRLRVAPGSTTPMALPDTISKKRVAVILGGGTAAGIAGGAAISAATDD